MLPDSLKYLRQVTQRAKGSQLIELHKRRCERLDGRIVDNSRCHLLLLSFGKVIEENSKDIGVTGNKPATSSIDNTMNQSLSFLVPERRQNLLTQMGEMCEITFLIGFPSQQMGTLRHIFQTLAVEDLLERPISILRQPVDKDLIV